MEHTILKPTANKPMNYANLKDLERLLKQSKERKTSKNPVVNALKHLPVIIGRKCEPLLNDTALVTLRAVELFHKYDIKVIIETKNVVDIDPYLEYIDGVNISLIPGSHELRNKLEPGLPDAGKRLKMGKRIKEAGKFVGITGEPILPTLNSEPECIEAWLCTITKCFEPDHINFGEFRAHSPAIADRMLSSVGIDLIPIMKGMKDWKEIGDMIFYAGKSHGIKISTPDWVNFADQNSCFSCCGLDQFGTHKFNFQFAKQCLDEDEHGVDWYHMCKFDIFGSVIFLKKFRDAFNLNNKKYFNLTDVGAIAERDYNKLITYKKANRISLKDAFK